MNFFKTLIAAIIGTFIALLLFVFILVVTLASGSGEEQPYIRDNSLLTITLSGDIPTRPADNPLDELFPQSGGDNVSLESLRENLDKAASHDNISGVLLEIDLMTAGWANLEEARTIIEAFRERSDKFIYAVTNDMGFNEKGFFLASAADSVFSPPESFFEFDGFYTEVMFMDRLFEMIGVEAEIARHGQYKGAVEPFMQQELSDDNRHQLNQIISTASSTFMEAAAEKSGLDVSEIDDLLAQEPQMTIRFGYENGLIDSLLYRSELDNLIKRRIGIDADDELQLVSNKRYSRVSPRSAGVTVPGSDNKIAVIHASGAIMPNLGESPFAGQQFITVDFFREQLDEIREDDDVKALVIRVNSPGGSGSTSDVIWHMINEVREEMPVIVSMGNVAASGGYYIAMAADSILAEENTLTGSIGVFSTKFNAKELFNEELGLTFGTVRSHPHADWLSPSRGFTPSEAAAFQNYVDEFYDTFITKVADSRGMDKQRVDELAGGRVWTGQAAYENGLVDGIGGLQSALDMAAEKAGITEYGTEQWPKSQGLFEVLTGSAQTRIQNWMGGSWFLNPYLEDVRNRVSMFDRKDALVLFPYEIVVE